LGRGVSVPPQRSWRHHFHPAVSCFHPFLQLEHPLLSLGAAHTPLSMWDIVQRPIPTTLSLYPYEVNLWQQIYTQLLYCAQKKKSGRKNLTLITEEFSLRHHI
jgi:hypothetical protein